MLKFARTLSLLLVAIGAAAPGTVAQPNPQEERIAASFVLALGRAPSRAESERWLQPASRPFADLLAQHREQLKGSADAQRAVVAQASQDALGRAPSGEETKGAEGATYTELVQGHLKRLAAQPAEYEQVLHRAYQRLLGRDAYSIEVEYWKRRPVTSYALLLASVEDWARRNQPGLMATAGTPSASVNSDYLSAVRLSPAVAEEVRTVTGLGPVGERGLAAAAGRHVIAPGGADIFSVGGIHFVAAGR
jgi:hypothetical protein